MGKKDKEKEKHDHKENIQEKTQIDEEEMNDEIRQTFPASDPPSATRPGHEGADEEE